MNRYIEIAKDYVLAHKKQFRSGAIVAVCVVGVATLVALFAYNNPIVVIYQPAKACDLLTTEEAQDLLGDRVISTERNKPTLTGNAATSKCSYTDENPDQNRMIVAAIAVRSGVNDKGVKQNKADFGIAKTGKDVEVVKDLGDSAYFNRDLGQLNILDGRKWIILSYGVGATPKENTVDDAIKLAHEVL